MVFSFTSYIILKSKKNPLTFENSDFSSQLNDLIDFSTGGMHNYGDCNPHGIDTILNRRTAAAAAALNSLTSQTQNSSSSPPPPPTPSNLPPGIGSSVSSSSVSNNITTSSINNSATTNPGQTQVNPYFKLEDLHQAAAQAAVQVASQQRPNVANAASLYWPGIQGLISNPNVWRDRFNGKIFFFFNLVT